MSVLPIAERELRVASRRQSTYWLRCFLALLVGSVWFILLIMGEGSTPIMHRGKLLFMALGIIAFAFSLFAGVFLTADCISEEKREGTIGLLFLTRLKGYDVVLGKLIATSVHSLYGLLAIFPLLALSLLLGGVTIGEFWRTTLVLTMTLLFSLSAGMIVSVFSREARQAMTVTGLIILVMAGFPPFFSVIQVHVFKAAGSDFLKWLSPLSFYINAFETHYSTRAGFTAFWASLVTIASLSLVAMAIASRRLPEVWSERDKTRSQEPREISGQRRFGTAYQRKALRRVLEINPFQWLAQRDDHPRIIAWMILIPLFVIWMGFYLAAYSTRVASPHVCFIIAVLLAYGMHQLLKYLISVETCRRLNEDRFTGALETLLVTPLTIDQILKGQHRALRALFIPHVLFLLLTNISLIILVLSPNPLRMNSEDMFVFCEMLLGGAMMLLFDFYALGWIGMWMALQKRRHHRAVLATLARVMFIPWLAILLLIFMTMGGRAMGADTVAILSVFWFALGATIEFVFILRAQIGLRETLRDRFVPAAETTGDVASNLQLEVPAARS